MMKPDKTKSDQSKRLLRQSWNEKMGSTDHTLVYGFHNNQPGQIVNSYILGFSPTYNDVVLIPISSAGEPGEPRKLFNSEDVFIKSTLFGETTICDGDFVLKLSTPAFTLPKMEDRQVLQIEQTKDLKDFIQFIKKNFA